MDKRKIRRQIRNLFKKVKVYADAGKEAYPVHGISSAYTCVIVFNTIGTEAGSYYTKLLSKKLHTDALLPFSIAALQDSGYRINDAFSLQNPLRAAWINKLARYVPKI